MVSAPENPHAAKTMQPELQVATSHNSDTTRSIGGTDTSALASSKRPSEAEMKNIDSEGTDHIDGEGGRVKRMRTASKRAEEANCIGGTQRPQAKLANRPGRRR